MKINKLLASAIIASTLFATVSESFAGSIGRSSSSSSSAGRSSSSYSSGSSASKSSSFSQPSKPPVAPAPSQAGGIGGNSASVGVRKSEVTNGVKQDVATSKGSTGSTSSTSSTGSSSSYSPQYTPTPSYSAPAVPAPSIGGGFGSSFLGAMGGTLVANALFGNHGSSGTTVINNGTPSSGGSGSGVVSNGPGNSVSDQSFNPGGMNGAPKKEYTVWSFIADLFGFVIVVALLIGIAWIFYKGFQLVRNYVNKERGVSNIPFNPTQQFWTIQKAFASADVTALQTLLGPDVVDELTNGLQASTLTLHNVSHEVRLANNTEFSIWYKFEDDGAEVNQVWHYEKFGKDWKLNGIENV